MTKPTKQQVREILFSLKTSTGMTQVQLADLLGVGQQAVSRYMLGLSGMSKKRYQKLLELQEELLC